MAPGAPATAPGADVKTSEAAVAAPGEASIIARLEAAEKRAEALEKRLSALEEAQASPEQDDRDILRIYGFIDVGAQRSWIDSPGLESAVPQANALNFVLGNLNLYLDAQPSDDFRFLGELRFTTAPGGAPTRVIPPPPGLAARTTTAPYASFDSTSTAIGGMTTYGGLVSIERAHVDWTRFNLFKVRVGQFFTPIGIYNVDHGSPVLITADIPYFITSRIFPTRQTGIMIYGSLFEGPWELGYNAYVSNGRTENAPFAFDDDRGFGGRLYASYENPGKLSLKLGSSFIISKARDWVADVELPTYETKIRSTWSYWEYVAAGDVSLDIGTTRLRAEAAVVRAVHEPGGRDDRYGIGFLTPDAWKTSAYVVAAHRFKFLNMEPFAMGAVLHAPFFDHDTMFQFGGGLNFYVTPDVTIRTQAMHTLMTILRRDSDVPNFDSTNVLARLILAF